MRRISRKKLRQELWLFFMMRNSLFGHPMGSLISAIGSLTIGIIFLMFANVLIHIAMFSLPMTGIAFLAFFLASLIGFNQQITCFLRLRCIDKITQNSLILPAELNIQRLGNRVSETFLQKMTDHEYELLISEAGYTWLMSREPLEGLPEEFQANAAELISFKTRFRGEYSFNDRSLALFAWRNGLAPEPDSTPRRPPASVTTRASNSNPEASDSITTPLLRGSSANWQNIR